MNSLAWSQIPGRCVHVLLKACLFGRVHMHIAPYPTMSVRWLVRLSVGFHKHRLVLSFKLWPRRRSMFIQFPYPWCDAAMGVEGVWGWRGAEDGWGGDPDGDGRCILWGEDLAVSEELRRLKNEENEVIKQKRFNVCPQYCLWLNTRSVCDLASWVCDCL